MAWQGGGGGGYPGVTSDGSMGLNVAGDVQLNGASHQAGVALGIGSGSGGNVVNLRTSGDITQFQGVAGLDHIELQPSQDFAIALSAAPFTNAQVLPVISVTDENGTATCRMNWQGGIGLFGKSPPTARTAIAGNVTTGTLSDLQGVVGALLTALDAAGYVTNSTT